MPGGICLEAYAWKPMLGGVCLEAYARRPMPGGLCQVAYAWRPVPNDWKIHNDRMLVRDQARSLYFLKNHNGRSLIRCILFAFWKTHDVGQGPDTFSLLDRVSVRDQAHSLYFTLIGP